MTSFFIYLISSYASVLSYTLLNEPYSSQLIGGASEVDQHAMVLCLIPSLSPRWVFTLTMWLQQGARFQLRWQRPPLWEMGNMASACAIHQREHYRERTAWFPTFCTWCVLLSRWGVLGQWGLNLVYCQEKKGIFCKVVSQNKVLDGSKHMLQDVGFILFFSKFLSVILISLFLLRV